MKDNIYSIGQTRYYIQTMEPGGKDTVETIIKKIENKIENKIYYNLNTRRW